MSSKDLDIKIKTSYEGRGANEADRSLNDIAKKGNKAGREISGGFTSARKSIENISKSMAFLNKIVTGFGLMGVIGAVRSVIGVYSNLKKSIEEAQKKQQELADGLAAIKEEMAAGFTAKTIDDLTASLKKANDELERAQTRRDAEKAASRASEDATSSLAERQELAAIDPSDPLASAKAGEIRAKYASQRGQSSAQRRLDDAAEKSRRLDAERTALLSSADVDDAEAAMLRKDAGRERGKAYMKRVEGDALVAPPWWDFWSDAKPDPVKQLEAAKAAQALDANAAKMSDDAEKKSSGASRKRADSGLLLDLLEQAGVERGAAYQGVEQARIEGSQGRRDAAAATESARLNWINGGMREGVYNRLDRGIGMLENSPTAQASPTARNLLASAQKFRQKVEGMDMESFLASIQSIGESLDKFDRILAEAQRVAKRTASRASAQRDND